MSDHAPAWIVVIPLVNALLLSIFAQSSRKLGAWMTRIATGGSLAFSLLALQHALQIGSWRYAMGGWSPPWGIELVVDPLSGLIATLVSAFAFLVSFYSGPYLATSTDRHAAVFYSLYCLLVAGLLGIVVTGDLFNLYVFLEISSLAAYALLASGGSRSVVATMRYLLVGTVAASFYLLGVGYLYAATGTLNMADAAGRMAGVDPHVATVGASFIVIGLAIKAALFPLHGWLPDAYTYAPGPVIGFIAAVMTKVSAYALYRILFFVLGAETAPREPLLLLGWASAVAAVAGAVMAVAQKDVQRMLAYSSVSQMGYIVLGISMATPTALTGAVLHVVNHAVMKGCLFLAVNGVQWQSGVFRVRDFAGMGRRFPFTMGAFVIAALSMIGVPPTAGFFSKYYLLLAAIETGQIAFLLSLVLSSLLGAVYLFRVLERAYLAEPGPEQAEQTERAEQKWRDLPLPMLAPVLLLALLALVLGVLNQPLAAGLVVPGLPF